MSSTSIFTRRAADLENQVESIGGWPLQVKEFSLHQDFEFEVSEQPELFLVLAGTFLHETEQNLQSMRAGSVIVSQPGQKHTVKQPSEARIVCVRYLPEWLANDIHIIMESPDLLSLFFGGALFDQPVTNGMQIVALKREAFNFVTSDLTVIMDQLKRESIDESLTRLTLLKMFLHISDEHSENWHQRGKIDLRNEILTAMRAVEGGIRMGTSLRLSTLEPIIGMSLDHFGRLFKKATGTTLVDYTQRRRVQHAARQLLFTDKTATVIAQELSFTDSAHFTKSFQRYLKRSPNEYRSHFAFNAAWLNL